MYSACLLLWFKYIVNYTTYLNCCVPPTNSHKKQYYISSTIEGLEVYLVIKN